MGLKARSKPMVFGDGPLQRLAAEVRDYALSLPGAWEDFPWEGDRVAKVGKKVFAFFGDDRRLDERFGMSVKLPESGNGVLAMPFAVPTGYGLGKWGWVSVSCELDQPFALELLQSWILESYRAVAPKKLSASIEAEE